MTHDIENSKINTSVDMLIESDNNLLNILGKELQRQLGVTYKTAWRVAHHIRKLMTTVITC